MGKEFHAVGGESERGNGLTGIHEKVFPGFVRYAFLFEPILQCIRPRKHANALAIPETMSCFAANDSSVVLQSFLKNRCCRHPEFVDLESFALLITLRVLQVEEIMGALDVITIKVRESDGSERIAFRLFQILPKLLVQIAALIIRIIRIAYCTEIEKNLVAVGQMYASGIGIPELIEREAGHL